MFGLFETSAKGKKLALPLPLGKSGEPPREDASLLKLQPFAASGDCGAIHLDPVIMEEIQSKHEINRRC